jgi:hypothetical protein
MMEAWEVRSRTSDIVLVDTYGVYPDQSFFAFQYFGMEDVPQAQPEIPAYVKTTAV